MKQTDKLNLQKFGLALPLALLVALAAAFLCGGALFFIYIIVLGVAWHSAMVCVIIAGACALSIGAGLLSVQGFKSYLVYYKLKLGYIRAAQKTAPEKTGVEKSFDIKKYLTVTNVGLAIMLLGSLLAVVSAFLGSLERANWVNAKAEYMESRGYYEDIVNFEVKYDMTGKYTVSDITLDLNYKTAVIIYDENVSPFVTVNGIIFYVNQIAPYIADDHNLVVKDNDPPELNKPIDKMLFFLFKGNKYESQVKIHIPIKYQDSIKIHGNYIVAQN